MYYGNFHVSLRFFLARVGKQLQVYLFSIAAFSSEKGTAWELYEYMHKNIA